MELHSNGGDTEAVAEALQLDAIRRLSPAQKLVQVFELTEFALALHEAGVRRRYPHLSGAELARASVVERYGEEAARIIFGERRTSAPMAP